jgi:hypothetical protein
LEPFTRRGVSLVSVGESLDTGTAAGRLVLNIMTAVSQWEREAIGERTRDAMHHKRSNGERVGTVPFGYGTAAGGLHLKADLAEQGILSRIRELKAVGQTTRQIADELNRQGSPPDARPHGGFSMWRKHSGRRSVIGRRLSDEWNERVEGNQSAAGLSSMAGWADN